MKCSKQKVRNNAKDQFFPIVDSAPNVVLLDSIKLIHEVKKYQIIYNTWMRRDNCALLAAWENVITALVPNYYKMNDLDKTMIKKKIRSRWSWMRGTLQRDLTRNSGHIHLHLNWMQEMQFLVPLLVNRFHENSDEARLEKSFCKSVSDFSNSAPLDLTTRKTTPSTSSIQQKELGSISFGAELGSFTDWNTFMHSYPGESAQKKGDFKTKVFQVK